MVTAVTKMDCDNGWLLLMVPESILKENDKLISLMFNSKQGWENKILYVSLKDSFMSCSARVDMA